MLSRIENLISEETKVRRISAILGNYDGDIVYLDVGSGGGQRRAIRRLIERRIFTGVSVDAADEWGTKRRSARGTRVKAALGDADCEATLHVTREPGCSSCLAPNSALLARYPIASWFEVIGEEQVSLRRFDSLCSELSLARPTFIKIDVQGFELNVLRGMGSLLSGVQGIELECQLRPIYMGQHLFGDIYDFLDRQGFALRALRPQGDFGGELVEFNGFWSRGVDKHLETAWTELNDL